MLKILILVAVRRSLPLQTGVSMAKACCAFFLLAAMSSSVPPVLLLTLQPLQCSTDPDEPLLVEWH